MSKEVVQAGHVVRVRRMIKMAATAILVSILKVTRILPCIDKLYDEISKARKK